MSMWPFSTPSPCVRLLTDVDVALLYAEPCTRLFTVDVALLYAESLYPSTH